MGIGLFEISNSSVERTVSNVKQKFNKKFIKNLKELADTPHTGRDERAFICSGISETSVSISGFVSRVRTERSSSCLIIDTEEMRWRTRCWVAGRRRPCARSSA